jgi:hypothetical protein
MHTDGDGVNDGQEADGTDPLNSDTDGDGGPMDKKKQMQQIPMITAHIVANQTETPDATWTAADCDSDGVSNGDEITNGTDPLNSDTDI